MSRGGLALDDASGATRPSTMLARFWWASRGLLHQPEFWIVLSVIVAITVFHWASEIEIGDSPWDEFHHLAVPLYIIPIMYASIRFGRPGGLLIGAFAMLLTIPNIPGYQEWALTFVEVAQVLIVVLVSVAFSTVVQRESVARQHAEALAERLGGLNGLMIRAQEEERLRITRELHDDAVQRLVHLSQRLDVAMTKWALPDFARDELAATAAEADAAADSLRRFSRDLRPSVLDDLGLVPAIRWMTDEMGRRSSTKASLRTVGVPARLGHEVELACFRIAQEALRNAERHAHAAAAEVALEFAAGKFRMRVSDNGDGFTKPESLNALVARGSLGLVGMFERARLIDAALDLQTSRGAGTVLTLEVAR